MGVLGLAYKSGTDVVEESPGIKLAQMLLRAGKEVTVYDPCALESSRPLLGNEVNYAGSVEDLVNKVELAVIATPWPEFNAVPELAGKEGSKVKCIVDCWRLLPVEKLPLGVDYVAVGRGE